MRPSWDIYFGYLVQVIRLRSDDAETQVGAVIVDKNNRIVSTGYNGTPKGTDLPKTRPEKYNYMVHSEMNAMLFSNRDLEGCKLYVLGMPPCTDCARAICQKGIKEIIQVNNFKRDGGKDWGDSYSMKMFNQVGIKYRKIEVPWININGGSNE